MGKTATASRRYLIWAILIFFIMIAIASPEAYKLHWYFVNFCIASVLIVGNPFSIKFNPKKDYLFLGVGQFQYDPDYSHWKSMTERDNGY